VIENLAYHTLDNVEVTKYSSIAR